MLENFNISLHAGSRLVYSGTLVDENGANIDLTGKTGIYIVTTPDGDVALLKIVDTDAGMTLGDGTVLIDTLTADTSQWSQFATLRQQLKLDGIMYGDGTITILKDLTGLTV